MKKHGILNVKLAAAIAALGHKDLFMVGDAGMPVPAGVEVIDLAVTAGVPTFREVMDAVLEETVVEGYTLADEIRENNPEILAYLETALAGAEESFLPHDALKKFSKECRFAVRTGEFTPYPNVILRAGVAF